MNLLAKIILLFFMIHLAHAQDLEIPHYDGAKVGDITQKGLRKEEIFSTMQKKIIKFKQSICANRAHMWAFDFRRFYNIESAKVLIFFTPTTSRAAGDNWWYHIAPAVNENGNFFVMDRAYFKGPVDVQRWLKFFVGTRAPNGCYEIKNTDTDLILKMFITMPFPETTERGTYNCYYKIVPSGIWFPQGIAWDVLGVDSYGSAINFVRNDHIDEEEVRQACWEAAARDDISRAVKRRCERYLTAQEPGAVEVPM